MDVEVELPREEIPWYPSVDPSRCDGCGECIRFCHGKVYAADAAGKAVVINPYGCKVGCSYCSTNVCTRGAISFPNLKWLREFLRTRGTGSSP